MSRYAPGPATRGRCALLAAFAPLALSCAGAPLGGPAPGGPVPGGPVPGGPAPLALPPQLAGKAVVVADGDPDASRADLASAVKKPGEGGLTRGLVVRLIADVPVWRMWSGPARKDARGRTNRIGQWWSYDPPRGTRQAYRIDYEICVGWNDLTYVAACTLKKGAVVAVGPGSSVSAATCGDATGKESYPASDRAWQVWVSKLWARGEELACPPEASDYEADPDDIARPRQGAGTTGR